MTAREKRRTDRRRRKQTKCPVIQLVEILTAKKGLRFRIFEKKSLSLFHVRLLKIFNISCYK